MAWLKETLAQVTLFGDVDNRAYVMRDSIWKKMNKGFLSLLLISIEDNTRR